MTPRALSEFRSRLPGCDLVVYADIASRTVLASDGALRYPQEYLDALCLSAAELLAPGSGLGGEPAAEVLFLTETGARAFFRAPDATGESLCCICAPEIDVTDLRREARAALGGAPA
ncbi:hypothetical protein HKCCE2091_14445 [Rhodobacterales bacterium HKCCE2091]|nr:hypothetical protein [Rhodobacterales bacterium HKCCE2091]